jgi:hypothetical protein
MKHVLITFDRTTFATMVDSGMIMLLEEDIVFLLDQLLQAEEAMRCHYSSTKANAQQFIKDY